MCDKMNVNIMHEGGFNEDLKFKYILLEPNSSTSQVATSTLLLLTLSTIWCADPDSDEGRPYEFGFTIDGQQHRHESKDINGIIMGEFGFITADGVYHVTVYATDENGSFKILSMKNIKISDRLDLPGAKLPDKLPIGNPRPVKEITTTTYRPTTTTTTTARAPYRFTTVPSLNKPSCSSCSLPSTTPRLPGSDNRLPFQTPQFQPGYKEPIKELVPPNTQQDQPETPPNALQPPLFPPQTNPQLPPINAQIPQSNLPLPPSNYPSSIPDRFSVPQPNPNQPPTNPQLSNALDLPKKPIREIPPKVTVDAGMITIPGRDPIPIKDKYPNMQDGLPAGITEHDMLDLLYKFNYTVGFHGHYEKGLKNGAKIGGYFVNGRDGISRVVEYIADENGYRPKVKFINLGLDSPYTPKEGTEKTFGLQGFEFEWYPV